MASAVAEWTVIAGQRELPARPLILRAAGVPPDDPTNSHQAVAILQDRGFDVRYEGKPVRDEGRDRTPPTVTDEFIRSLRGSSAKARVRLSRRESGTIELRRTGP
jgi:hypothetical protein